MNSSSGDWNTLAEEVECRIREARRMRSEAMGELFAVAGRKLLSLARAAWQPIAEWRERSRLASELHGMTDHELADIGLTRCDIESVVEGRYRSERGKSVRRRPLLVRLDPGVRRIKVDRITSDHPKAA